MGSPAPPSWQFSVLLHLSPPSASRRSLLQMYVAGGSLTSTYGSSQMTSSSSKHNDEGSLSTKTTLAVQFATLHGETALRWGSPATRCRLGRRGEAGAGATMSLSRSRDKRWTSI